MESNALSRIVSNVIGFHLATRTFLDQLKWQILTKYIYLRAGKGARKKGEKRGRGDGRGEREEEEKFERRRGEGWGGCRGRWKKLEENHHKLRSIVPGLLKYQTLH